MESVGKFFHMYDNSGTKRKINDTYKQLLNFPNWPNSLGEVCDFLRIEHEGVHDAINDVRATIKLLRVLESRPDTIKEQFRTFAQN